MVCHLWCLVSVAVVYSFVDVCLWFGLADTWFTYVVAWFASCGFSVVVVLCLACPRNCLVCQLFVSCGLVCSWCFGLSVEFALSAEFGLSVLLCWFAVVVWLMKLS